MSPDPQVEAGLDQVEAIDVPGLSWLPSDRAEDRANPPPAPVLTAGWDPAAAAVDLPDDALLPALAR